MAGTRQGHRDSDDATVVDRKTTGLNNPLQTPEKTDATNSEKKGNAIKDEEGQVRVDEASLSEASIKVKQLSWQEAAGLMCTYVHSRDMIRTLLTDLLLQRIHRHRYSVLRVYSISGLQT